MYAFRKPFTAGLYEGLTLWGLRFKILLVVAQVAGYALSKFIGIQVISSMKARQRGLAILLLIGVAELALVGFALTPYPWNAAWMFVNGLPLGMIWGLVFGYLEGRRTTEVLTAVLSVNFILSSGFVKTTGRWLLDSGVSEWWMPAVTGLLFVPLLLVSVVLLERLPPPAPADLESRSPRVAMNRQDRKAMFLRYAPGLVMLIAVYLLLTVIRDVRDNFAVEIWADLGFKGQPAILTTAEIPVALLTLAGISTLMIVRNNFRALKANLLISGVSVLILGASTFAFRHGALGPVVWMIVSGVGLFVPYILFNGILFDRLLAAFRERGNVGFLMYTADAFGYLGSTGVLLWRNFGAGSLPWLDFFTSLCYAGSVAMLALIALAWQYFLKKHR